MRLMSVEVFNIILQLHAPSLMTYWCSDGHGQEIHDFVASFIQLKLSDLKFLLENTSRHFPPTNCFS